MKRFLVLVLALGLLGSSMALADGRGRGRSDHRDGWYQRDYARGRHAFKRFDRGRGYAYGRRIYPRYYYYAPYPAYPPPVYGYYSSCPPPVYGPYYRRGGTHGRIGAEIIF